MTTTSTGESVYRPDTEPLLTIDEAAEYLSITKATLYTWRSRRTGYGPRAVKVGGCLRYRHSDLDAWIIAHTEDADDSGGWVDSKRGKAPHPAAGVALTRRSSQSRG